MDELSKRAFFKLGAGAVIASTLPAASAAEVLDDKTDPFRAAERRIRFNLHFSAAVGMGMIKATEIALGDIGTWDEAAREAAKRNPYPVAKKTYADTITHFLAINRQTPLARKFPNYAIEGRARVQAAMVCSEDPDTWKDAAAVALKNCCPSEQALFKLSLDMEMKSHRGMREHYLNEAFNAWRQIHGIADLTLHLPSVPNAAPNRFYS